VTITQDHRWIEAKIYFAVSASAVAATVALAGCGSNNVAKPPPSSATAQPTTSNQDSSSTATPSAPAGTDAPTAVSPVAPPAAASGPKIPVNQTITDPTLGNHVAAQGVVRDFPIPASMSSLDGGEIVLVQISATADANWQAADLDLVTADGTENTTIETGDLDNAMQAAGYEPFPATGDIQAGKPVTGWVAFLDNQKDSPTLTLRMKRPASIGANGQSIPEQDFDIPLVK
jgi:hypothetical protein